MYLNLDLLYSINEYFYGVFTFVHHKSHMGDQYYIYRNNKMLVYDRKNTLYQFIDYKNKYSFNFLKNQQEKFYFYFKDPHFDVFDFSYEKEFIPPFYHYYRMNYKMITIPYKFLKYFCNEN